MGWAILEAFGWAFVLLIVVACVLMIDDDMDER